MGSNISDRASSVKGRRIRKDAWDGTNIWHPQRNPNGYISLGLAENSLMHSELRDFLNTKTPIDSNSKAFTYGDASLSLRLAISRFLTSQLQPARPFTPDQMFATSGVNVAIEHCAWGLANAGDGILVGRPYHRMFIQNIQLRMNVRFIPVSFGAEDPFRPAIVQDYEAALHLAHSQGITVRALLLCHPHNPLGRYYPLDTLIQLLKFCQKHQIHIISDEIYALSTFPTRDTHQSFHSVSSIDTTDLIDPSLVHILWGPSKDFGASGLRTGVVISQSNLGFLAALRTCGLYSAPSSLAENAVVEVLSDGEFARAYVEENRRRIAEAYGVVGEVLGRYGLEWRRGVNAAFFVWVDLGRAWIEARGGGSRWEGLTEEICGRCLEEGVVVVGGDLAGAEEEGWVRVVFTRERGEVEEGVRRIARAVLGKGVGVRL
ncbi:PLP-dependent transferase [Aaosphaeria arxii CBS 175.79]|uniref:PLP-dependent transferase n=1 Tax=Aaosphaeria arxii CBS 175.79 TaxID=1450172 RepID=A0A6A5X689_9PLEO|nr:PLP-dependent transferase [Aaosphaeria arxii CBS 175.79]KAF2008498.1 PLP-dependent transferase [Aaosphaeria arxii CBS 175.79]